MSFQVKFDRYYQYTVIISHVFCNVTLRYIEDVRDRYHKKGAVYELPLGTKQKLNLVDSSQWTMERLYSLQNSIAEPILVYW